jgi:hypothetical protein
MLALAAWLVPPPVGAEDVRTLLARAGRAARSPQPMRADGRLERPDAAPLPIVLATRGTSVYVETADGTRALVKPAKAVVSAGGRLRVAPPGTALAGSDVLLEDLAPFTATRLAVPQVSDDGPLGTAVTGAPVPPSAYVLVVATVDSDTAAVVRTKYYVDTVTNLVKMRRDGALADVAGRPRPAEIVVERFRPPRTTRLSLSWREAPGLSLGLAALRGASLLPPAP